MKIITAAVPRVGIYWFYPAGNIISFGVDYREAASVAGFRDSPYDHVNYWDRVVKLHPELQGKEYYEIPRGRVIYIEANKVFRIVSDQNTCNNKSLVIKVCREFSIPITKVECQPDMHYEMNPDFGDEDD